MTSAAKGAVHHTTAEAWRYLKAARAIGVAR